MGKSYLLQLSLLSLIITSGCDMLPLSIEEEAVTDREPVARVDDVTLYRDDLAGLSFGASTQDSSAIAKKYVEGWVSKQLLINKANGIIEIDQAEIDRRVRDYRYALITHEYEKYWIEDRLSKSVSEEEIVSYYEEKKDNFLLKQNIVKCLFAQIPKEAPRVSEFRRQIRAFTIGGDIEDIRSYAFRFAAKSFMEDSIWVNFDDVILNTPLASIPNKVQFLRTNSFVESSDETHIYFLKLLEYKISDEISPLEFIRDDIENIIINKRKVALKKELQETIYKEALENETFEIY
ncbi:MAG: peptidyl-prolyl cis-trans isomerase [Cyclobacteriaceae bacterium]